MKRDKNCTNCGKPLGNLAGAVLDGNPKHQAMCKECMDKLLDDKDLAGMKLTLSNLELSERIYD